MQATREMMPVKMIGARAQDLDMFSHIRPEGIETSVYQSRIPEQMLRVEMETAPQNGYQYVAEMSRNRFGFHREELRVTEPGADYAMITSDTALVVEIDGRQVVVNETLPQAEQQRCLEEINRQGQVSLIGAATFGRKQGESMMTVLTYYDFPLAGPVTELPQDPHDLFALKNPDVNASVGYIQPQVGPKGELGFSKRTSTAIYPQLEHRNGNEPEEDRFVTGVTGDVVRLAEKTAEFGRDVAPIMEESVGSHPFNTVAFYNEFLQSEFATPREYYDDLIKSGKYQEHFEKYGGNCSLFVLDMIPKLEQRGYKTSVAVYSGDTPKHAEGHGAVIASDDDYSYFIDPGLSFTYPIPISKEVPLFPVIFGGSKVVLLDVAYVNEDNVPDLIILKGAKKIVLPGNKAMSVGDFKEMIPRVLSELHDIRKSIKMDFHNTQGVKQASVLVDRKTHQVGVQVGDEKGSMQLEAILDDAGLQEELQHAYASRGVDFYGQILPQLVGLESLKA